MSDLHSSSPDAFEPSASIPAAQHHDEDEPILAEAVESPHPLWPAFVAVIGAIVASVAVSSIALAAAAVVTGNLESLLNPKLQIVWLTDLGSSGIGLSLLVLPGQLTFAFFAIGAAWLSRDKWLDSLGIRAGRLPAWTWPLFLAGTPVIGLISSLLMSGWASETSDHLKMLERMLEFDSIGSLLYLLGLISLLPGIVEELLFRGFMQRRLLTRLPAVASITICSFFFAAAHMDPMHAIGVLPLGMWLGVISWRADSICPAIFGHIGNNAYAIIMAKMIGPNPDPLDVSPEAALLIGVSLISFLGSLIVLLRKDRTPASQESTEGVLPG